VTIDKIRADFGSHLKALRKVKNLSQEQLAEKADLHPTFIGAVERGTKSPTLDSLGKIARALQVSLKDLFSFSSSQKDKLKDEINSYLANKDLASLSRLLNIVRSIDK
jgi:transcriptional regulator with XRE-family HTH domain